MDESTPSKPRKPVEFILPPDLGRRRFVIWACAVMAVLFVVAVGLLYHGWLTQRELNSVIAVIGGPQHEGWATWIERGDDRVSADKMLEKDNQFSTTFFLPASPAVYRVCASPPGGPRQVALVRNLKDGDRHIVRLGVAATTQAAP
jgi:hypothetical protein